jgi:hypothetical protein
MTTSIHSPTSRFAAEPAPEVHVDWFERLVGFQERAYADTKAKLAVDGERLASKVNGRSYGSGRFAMVSLAELRQHAAAAGGSAGRPRVSIVTGDVGLMHQAPEYAGAMFQVASQTNCLEMVGPGVTPEQGVTGYQHDRTQGPACAIAAGAATIFRNYFAPVGDQHGQTATRQLDGLADLGAALSAVLDRPVQDLWTTRNGYALATRAGLGLISTYLASAGPETIDDLRSCLRIGLHADVEVTAAATLPGPVVSQAFCSALPVAYSGVPAKYWAPFATLVLEAGYEATLLAAVQNCARGGSTTVLLTMLGGGAFGNDDEWIHHAVERAIGQVGGVDLDIRLVSYGAPSAAMHGLVGRLQAA